MQDADKTTADGGCMDISPDVLNSTASDDASCGNMAGFDFFSSHLYPTSGDSTTSIAELLSEHMPEATLPTPDTFGHNTSPPCPRLEQEKTLATYTTSADAVPIDKDGDLLGRLLEIQPRLVKLAIRFADNASTTDDVEEIYRVTEAMVNIIRQIEEQWLGSPHQPSSIQGIFVLVLSSCYFSLVQAYRSLVELLAEGLKTPPRSVTNGVVESSLAGLGMNVPSISVGGLRLAIPRKAAAELNLHVVAQTVQYLKRSQQTCIKCMDDVFQLSRASGDGINSVVDSLETPYQMKNLVWQAVGQLDDGEGELFDRLHDLVGRTNDRMFSIR